MKHLKPVCAFLMMALFGLVLNGQTIKTMTYNIRYDNPKDGPSSWDNRKDVLISQLKFHAPDVFGTQEALAHQLQDIKSGLGGYQYTGKGRDDGESAGEFSAIFYNTEKLELLKGETFWLSETPESPSKGWDAALNRVCTYGLFRTKKDQKKFYVFNTHFDHIGEEARSQSVYLILKKIDEINKEDLPVVVMGDLNLEPDHPAIQHLASKMKDTHQLAKEFSFGPEGTFSGFEVDGTVSRRIDYIFISQQGFELMRYAILSHTQNGRYPSDHLPVYAELSFER
ncbi:endonuclease/exonuclease/phosphatase family protein [Poritiphilus flavus]|uniref:Endonuclease/exonuclease/phosphatase n=1 Tax=Poritiphilus flavus TaxID=2697053 RepID=A0A6L9ECT2_9FLAO|nr:endonuclease/exonuclease/phosphatase family protein [Poritiphilus flavus]NAS12421.1 endonuclease/exonuclease/phosphatase [Poritiphilus flavus]